MSGRYGLRISQEVGFRKFFNLIASRELTLAKCSSNVTWTESQHLKCVRKSIPTDITIRRLTVTSEDELCGFVLLIINAALLLTFHWWQQRLSMSVAVWLYVVLKSVLRGNYRQGCARVKQRSKPTGEEALHWLLVSLRGGGGLRPHRRILSHCLSRWRGYRSEVVICAVHIGVCSIRCAWRSLSSLITMRVVSTTRHSSIFVAMAVLYNVSVIITTHSNVHRLPFQVENSKKGRVSFLNFMYYSWSRERVTADCTYFAMFFFCAVLDNKGKSQLRCVDDEIGTLIHPLHISSLCVRNAPRCL